MANVKHGVVRTDKMTGTDVRSELVSLRYSANNAFADIDNGNVVVLGALETGKREVYTAAAPTANADFKAVALVASPEVMYDERLRNLEDFYNEAGTIARGYRLHDHDIFSVTIDALDGKTTPEVGDVVELKAGTKLNVAASLTSGSTKIGKIIDINIVGKKTYYAIEVACAG